MNCSDFTRMSGYQDSSPNYGLQAICHILPMFDTLRLRQNGRHFPDDICKCIFLNENVWISIRISLKFVAKGPINNIPALVQIMARRRPGNKPLSELVMVSLLTHISITRPQWVNSLLHIHSFFVKCYVCRKYNWLEFDYGRMWLLTIYSCL